MRVIEGQVTKAYGRAAHQTYARAAGHFEVKPNDQFMAARGDLEKAPVVQPLLIQALSQEQSVIREWRREIDPGHLWIRHRQRRLTTCDNTGSE
ncbi:hypothetical protein D3C72_2089030 [compost metagenome]